MAHRIAVPGPGAVGHAPDAAAAESAASLSAKTYADGRRRRKASSTIRRRVPDASERHPH